MRRILFALLLGLFLGFPDPARSEAPQSPRDDTAAPQSPALKLDEPVFRVRSEVVRWREITPPDLEEASRELQKRYSATELENWRQGYQMESASTLVLHKLVAAFCEQAHCTPEPKDVADWHVFLDT